MAEGCPDGTFECDGRCVDLLSDPDHCGNCATRCPRPEGAVAQCIDAECSLTCPGLGGRSVDFDNDPENCGRCGNRCPGPPGFLTACPDRCTLIDWDASNCGECGHVCPEGTTCEEGECV